MLSACIYFMGFSGLWLQVCDSTRVKKKLELSTLLVHYAVADCTTLLLPLKSRSLCSFNLASCSAKRCSVVR